MKLTRLGIPGLFAGLILAACGGGATPASSAPAPASVAPSKPAASALAAAPSSAASAKPAASTSASAKPAASGQATAITLALGYIPNVQFAPFYVAQAKGFYKDEGVDISFDNGISPDLIKAVGAGKFKFAIADPDTVISAREQSIPVTYVAGLYAQAPSAIISLPGANIRRPQDLKGKKIGLPGRYGSGYIGLLGVLNKAGLSEKDVDIQEIGFNQAPQLLAGKVDAVVGFANNDALQVQAQANTKPNVIPISDVIPFIGNGLVTNDDTLKSNDKLVQGMARAMLKGMQYTAAHPDEAFLITAKVVPEAGGQNAKLNQDVLAASIPLWKDKGTDANGLGYTDTASWKAMEDVMAKAGIVKTPPPVDQLVTNKYISKDLKI
ncbi:MAG TPA: ABC transporter substrate-binding protein [Chloroflexota bacterium]|jgi:NitT/TauT family transport system substrate-binding protein|nr:ABC transporter substrate-binding protein [Chloroflexota bacterium]